MPRLIKRRLSVREFFMTVVVGLLVFLLGVVFVAMMTLLFMVAGVVYTWSFIKGFFIEDYG